jgi:hypothetical protein
MNITKIQYKNQVVDYSNQSIDELKEIIKSKFIMVKTPTQNHILNTDLILVISEISTTYITENDLVIITPL